MRIDAYSAVSQIYQANKTTTAAKRADSQQSSSDRLEFSQTAKSYQTAKTAVNSASDVRMDKIAEIKAMMAAGTYNISSEAIADKIVSSMEAIVF